MSSHHCGSVGEDEFGYRYRDPRIEATVRFRLRFLRTLNSLQCSLTKFMKGSRDSSGAAGRGQLNRAIIEQWCQHHNQEADANLHNEIIPPSELAEVVTWVINRTT